MTVQHPFLFFFLVTTDSHLPVWAHTSPVVKNSAACQESEFPFVLSILVLWMDWLAVPCVFRARHGSGRAFGSLRSTTRVSCFLVVPVLLSLR
jgi:hypothetical protein